MSKILLERGITVMYEIIWESAEKLATVMLNILSDLRQDEVISSVYIFFHPEASL